MKYIKCVSAFLSIIATSSHAELFPIIQIGVGSGGDDLAGLVFTDGDEQKVTAGGGISFEGGVVLDPEDKLSKQFLIGYKSDESNASNGDIKMSRVYLTALGIYNIDNIGVGGGITYHVSPELSSSGAISDGIEADFESALGGVLQAGYNFSNHSSVGLKATVIDYKLDDSRSSQSIDANAFDLYFSYTFQ